MKGETNTMTQQSSSTASALAAAPRTGFRAMYNAVAARLQALVPHDLLAIASRVAIAAIFYLSGRTKVSGVLTVTDSTYSLFESEYQLPLIPYDIAAHIATYAEHLFPILLVLGLFTRLSAVALLVMTLTIQFFVYPDAWPTHLSWAALLLYLIGRGAGRLSVDRALRID